MADILIVLLLLIAPSPSLLGKVGKPGQFLKPMLMRTVPFMNEGMVHYDSGYKSRLNEIPYIVALEFLGQRTTWFCAGSIIAHRWIVTVASCTNAATLVKISYGARQRTEPFKQMRVASNCFFPHPGFDNLLRNDIALIETPYVPYSPGVTSVALPKTAALFTNAWAYSAGWGQHRGSREIRNHLHVLQIKVVSNKNCTQHAYGRRFHSEMLCARLPNKETSCHLDSGSPLVLQTSAHLIGIVSFGNQKGCQSNTPLGFTRITSYMNWMVSVISENEIK